MAVACLLAFALSAWPGTGGNKLASVLRGASCRVVRFVCL